MTQQIDGAAKEIAVRAQDGATEAEEIHKRAAQTKETTVENRKKVQEMLGEIRERLEKALEDAKVVEQIGVLVYVGHKHFAFILRCYCPAVGSVVFTAGKNTVILSLADQFMIFVIHCGLLRNQLSLFFRQFCDIKLIAERSGQCHMASRCKRSYTANRVVRAYADVCTH